VRNRGGEGEENAERSVRFTDEGKGRGSKGEEKDLGMRRGRAGARGRVGKG
jgi:hypothetical protein